MKSAGSQEGRPPNLSASQAVITRRLGIRKTIQLSKLSLKLLNVLCNACKKEATTNNDPEKWCTECKEKAAPILEKIKRIGG